MHYFKKNLSNKLLYFLLSILLTGCNNKDYKKINPNNGNDKIAEFIGSKSCKSCHKNEFALWKGSQHNLSMQIADSSTILGNFNNIIYVSKDITYKFFKKENDYYVNTEGEGGKYKDYKIIYTFGVYPLQQYLIQFPGDRYQCLLAAWDSKSNKWFDLQPNLKTHPDEWMHWTGGSMTWNNMCADCHSTNLHKNFDATTNTYNTTYSIINVSCEACHGPSSEHASFYQNPNDYLGQSPPKLYMGKVVEPKELVQKCARCHSRRNQLTDFFDYKGHYLDHYNPSLIINPIYELDGQIKDEDYVYGSFLQSKMYHNGVSCKDCHNIHSLQLKKQGNDLCLTCHEPKYNTYQHHFHKLDSGGALCINCHMQGKYYMGNDFRRDHSFRVPRPDQSVTYGTPNACNQCHTDKSTKWAADFVKKKYGAIRPDHFSNFMLPGYEGDTDAFYKVFSQYKYPEIIRATALEQYSNSITSYNQIDNIINFLQDSSALVRSHAIQSLDKLQGDIYVENIKPLLLDTTRIVRIAAARYFAMRNIPLDENPTYQKALNEFFAMLNENADFASGQHQIALYQQAKGNIEDAVKAYKKAIEIDSYYNLSRLNLALLEYNNANVDRAEALYLKVTEQEPQYSYPYFMLGLLYNEKGNVSKTLKYLELATQKKPFNVRAFYNYALKLQEKGNYKKSVEVVEKALQNNPRDEEILYVKLIGELNSGNNEAAYNTCQKLLKIAPDNVNYQNIYTKLKNN